MHETTTLLLVTLPNIHRFQIFLLTHSAIISRLFACGLADATVSQNPDINVSQGSASFKSRLVLPFCYGLTEVVLEKRPLNGCSSSNSSSSSSRIMLVCNCACN